MTPARRWPRQLVGFWLARSPELRARLVRQRSLPVQFKELNFLYTARWVRVGRFPQVDGQQRRERHGLRWVLFCANFVGDSDSYVRAFMDVIPEGVYDLWGPAVGWPGFPSPETATDLFSWVRKQLIPTQHYYVAYPHATNNDVRAALRLRRELMSLVADLKADPPAESRNIDGPVDDLARRVQQCLGTVPAPPSRPCPRTIAGCAANPTTSESALAQAMHGVVALFPIFRGAEPDMVAELASLPDGDRSPFRDVPGTHFARLAIIDREAAVRSGLGHPLEHSHLLLAADFDGVASEFFEATFEALGRDSTFWRHCRGVDTNHGPRAFAHQAERCTVPVLAEYIDYPGQSLQAVLAALYSQRQFVQALQEVTPPDAAALHAMVSGRAP